MKDAGFRIRVQRELREQFVDACRANDTPAAQVLREFMRDYVVRHARGTDGERARIGAAPSTELYRLKR